MSHYLLGTYVNSFRVSQANLSLKLMVTETYVIHVSLNFSHVLLDKVTDLANIFRQFCKLFQIML